VTLPLGYLIPDRGDGVLVRGDALIDLADTSAAVAEARWREYLAVETPKLRDFMPIWRTAGDNDRLDVTARLKAWSWVFSHYRWKAYPTARRPRRCSGRR